MGSNWYIWLVPVIVGILIPLVPAVLRSSNRIAILEERSERNKADIGEERLRNDTQDQRQVSTDILLARIDSNLTTLMRRLEQTAHLP